MRTVSLLAVVAVLGLMGCECNKKSGSAGAVSEQKSGCCQNKDASMGATGAKKDGCEKACTEKSSGSMGAVGSEKKSGCCAGAKN